MSTKECPSCGITVPMSASRCKECFHDFAARPARRSWMGPLLILGSVAGMTVVAAVVLMVVTSAPVEERILVDGDSKAIIWTRQYTTGVETEMIPFERVTRLEYVVKGGGGGFEVIAVTNDGLRHTLAEGMAPLGSMAENYARIMVRPLQQIDHSGGQTRGH